MASRRVLWLGLVGWLGGVTLLHLWLNTHLLDRPTGRPETNEPPFRVGFLPVT